MKDVYVIQVPKSVSFSSMKNIRENFISTIGSDDVLVTRDYISMTKMSLDELEILGKSILEFVDLKREKELTSSEQ